MLFPLPMNLVSNQRMRQRFQIGKFLFVGKDDCGQFSSVDFETIIKHRCSPTISYGILNVWEQQSLMPEGIRGYNWDAPLAKHFRDCTFPASDSADYSQSFHHGFCV